MRAISLDHERFKLCALYAYAISRNTFAPSSHEMNGMIARQKPPENSSERTHVRVCMYVFWHSLKFPLAWSLGFFFLRKAFKMQHYLWTSHYMLRTHARKYRVNICTLIHINGTSWKNICTADEYRRYLNLEQRRLQRERPAKISLRARLIDKWS